MSGLGLFSWKDGQKYFGFWKDDKLHGKGRFTWRNGDSFLGSYENDLKSGEGAYYFKAKNSYLNGVWKNGKKEGSFSLTENSQSYQLLYFNDLIIE